MARSLTSQIVQLQTALAQPLPGWEKQRLMAPGTRPTDRDRSYLMRDDYQESSILLLLYPNEAGTLHFILIRRPEYDGVHSGQIAFPGGRREGDESHAATALREAHEEIGVCMDTITILGTLTSLYIPPSNFLVYPHVGYCPARPEFRPDQREVAEILESPLILLFNESIRQEEQRQFPSIGWATIPYYAIGGHKVWGATAMMLAEFTAILTRQFPNDGDLIHHD